MRCLVLVCLFAACSNGQNKREEAALPVQTKQPLTPAAAPRVILETPTGELAVNVEVVDTPARIQRGLMYREHLPPDDGMLFLMGYEHDHAFYMRNTLIPLDMLFITKDKVVAGIVERAEPRTETLRRVGTPTLYVLELNGGWTAAHGVKPGARVRFENIKH